MRLDDAQFDQLMAMLDEIDDEYIEMRERNSDAFMRNSMNLKLATLDRIKREIIVRSGRLPEGSTF